MKHSVLIVDDEKVICDGLERLFEDYYTIYKASNGLDAIDILKKHTDIDVMLCDLKMPVMDGNELIERTRDHNLDTFIIIVTAATATSICEAMQRGANDFMRKPIDINQLEMAINKAIISRKYPSRDDMPRKGMIRTV